MTCEKAQSKDLIMRSLVAARPPVKGRICPILITPPAAGGADVVVAGCVDVAGCVGTDVVVVAGLDVVAGGGGWVVVAVG